MILILSTSSSDENFNGDCDYAVVNLTPELARLAISRIDMVRKAKAKDKGVYSIDFRDYSAGYVGFSEKVEELLEACPTIPRSDIRHAEKVDIPEEAYQSTIADTMVATDDEVSWETIPRHSNVTVETAGLPLRYLEALAGTTSRRKRRR